MLSRLLSAIRQKEWAATGYLAGWMLLDAIPHCLALRGAYLLADVASRRPQLTATLRRNLDRAVGFANADAVAEERTRHSSCPSGQPALDATKPDDLVRLSLRSYARYWVEVFRLQRLVRVAGFTEQLEAHSEGLEHLRASINSGRGVVLTLPHSGNWDMAGVELVHLNGRFATVAERLRPEILFDAFVDFRQALGFDVLPHRTPDGVGPYKQLVEVLRAGGVVCLMGERDLKGTGVPVSFFGEPTTFPAGPAKLALDTGAALHAVHSFYPEEGKWGLSVSPELPVTTLKDTTQRIADYFVERIAAHPADWHALQPIWPTDRGY